MNSGFYPTVVMPGCFRVQTQSQQLPFYFGASTVPLDLAMSGIHIAHNGIPEPDHVAHAEKPKRPRKKSAKKKADKK